MASVLRAPCSLWRTCLNARSTNRLSAAPRLSSLPSQQHTQQEPDELLIVSDYKSYSNDSNTYGVSLTENKYGSTNSGSSEPTATLPSWIKKLACGFGLSITAYVLFKKEAKESTTLSQLPTSLFATAKCGNGGDSGLRSRRYNFLAEAVEIASPSVVYIEKSQRVATIFGEVVGVSSGSGFVVHDGRYVLTNAHVVANSRSVKVKLSNGRVVRGEVTDIDQVSDLALVKLDLPSNESLTAATFGSSSSLRPGEWVVALGSPLNLTNTITAGIVSSVLRPSKELGLEHHKPDMEYVQTDAPITHGNSGGPLVNLDGEVIGVNTMTAGPGISFAIPSDFAQSFVEKATKTVKKRAQTVSKYAIGVSMLSISPSIMRVILQRISLPQGVTHGVFLANVWPNSAAAQAGLRKGDVIVRINGKNMYTSKDVNEMVQTGVRMSVEVVRKSKWVTVNVVPEPLYADD